MSGFHGYVHETTGQFDLDPIERAKFRAYCRRFKGEEVTIEVYKRRTKRSDQQNKLLWALLTPWAHELGYEPVELKDELLGLLWGYDEVVSKLTGEVRRVPVKARSSQLTTAEFSQFVEFMAIKAAETGYVMELPEEFKARKAKERRQVAA